MARTGDRITKRKDGLYMARYTIQEPDGPKRKTIYGKRYGEVQEQLTKAMADRDGGLVFDAGKLTVGEYLARWLADSVKDTVRQRTYEGYAHMVERHIVPALGRVKLKNLTPTHVRGLYRERLDSGLSPRTVQYAHTTLNKALSQAVRDGLIPRNAAASVKPPRPRRKEIRPLDREQVHTFLEAVSGDRLEALYVLAISAGLRQGELLGLRWEDLDLDTGMLQVRRTLSQTQEGRIFEAPKSGKGRRRPAHEAGYSGPQSAQEGTAGGTYRPRRIMGGERASFRLRSRDADRCPQPTASFQDQARPCRVAVHGPISRPTPHVRHAPTQARRTRQVRPGASRT